MNEQDITGAWKLVSMKAENDAGEVLYPFGENPSGMIMYDPSGYMSYTAMRAGRLFEKHSICKTFRRRP